MKKFSLLCAEMSIHHNTNNAKKTIYYVTSMHHCELDMKQHCVSKVLYTTIVPTVLHIIIPLFLVVVYTTRKQLIRPRQLVPGALWSGTKVPF